MWLIQSILVFLIAVSLWDVLIVNAGGGACTCGSKISGRRWKCGSEYKTCYNGGTCKRNWYDIGTMVAIKDRPYCDCPTSSGCNFPGSNCQQSDGQCCAINGKGEAKPCVFPFKYGGYTFKSCTFYGGSSAYGNQGWCATKVNSKGEYNGQWGVCAWGCPREMEMCSGGYSTKGRSLAPKGTKCTGKAGKNPCIYRKGYWGSSFCWTSLAKGKNDWGALCAPCR